MMDNSVYQFPNVGRRTSMDYMVVIVFTWGIYKIATKTPRALIQEMSTQEGFITARAY